MFEHHCEWCKELAVPGSVTCASKDCIAIEASYQSYVHEVEIDDGLYVETYPEVEYHRFDTNSMR